jgi:glycosyltransferase involved in cell wall biosynthesis
MTSSVYPLVAIVTPVFNGEQYLAETMECVQALTYPNLIHIVLDNASDDATPDILEHYRKATVPLLTKRNEVTIPMIANFNAAVGMIPDEARYFRLLCADDLMATDAITKKVEIAERDPSIGLVGCLSSPRGAGAEGLPKTLEIFEGREVVRSFLRREHLLLHGTEFLIRNSNHIAKRFYDSSFQGASDTDANVRVCLGGKFGFVHEELATFRQHDLSHFAAWSRSNFHMTEWLMLLDRYGPLVLTDREYRNCRARYKRYYLRRLLHMRWREREKTLFRQHLALLRKRNDPASLGDFLAAVGEWVLRRNR